MFVIELLYKADLKRIDAHMGAHMKFLRKYYAAGNFLASGRKVPRTGGIIFARGDRAELEAYVAVDPFTIHGVAAYEVTEIALTTVSEGLETLKS